MSDLDQRVLEASFSKQRIVELFKEEFGEEIVSVLAQAIDLILRHSLEVVTNKPYQSKLDRYIYLSDVDMEELVTSILLHTVRAQEIQPIQAVASAVASKVNPDDHLSSVKTVLEILAVLEQLDMYTLYHADDYENPTGTLGIRSNYVASQYLQQRIEVTLYLPPMVSKPLKWGNNVNGGYLTINQSVILGRSNHHGEKQALDAINILQNVEWEIDEYIDQFMEESKKDLDTHQKRTQFQQYRDNSEYVTGLLKDHGNKFYFVWRYDKRGRMYSQGYHVNLQSTEYKKALLNFTKKELIQ